VATVSDQVADSVELGRCIEAALSTVNQDLRNWHDERSIEPTSLLSGRRNKLATEQAALIRRS
jgi:hypothetical protein